jgi:RecG-like helicase
VDFTKTVPIGSLTRLRGERDATVRGTITELKEIPGKRTRRAEARISDGTGWARVTWFNVFVARPLQVGQEIVVSGTMDLFLPTPSFTNPEWERVRDGHGLPPSFPHLHAHQRPLQKTLRGLTAKALAALSETLPDPLPTPSAEITT